MSLDFQALFATKPKRLPASVEGAEWVVNVEPAIRIEAEDLPPGLRAMLGKRSWQSDLHLEGEVTPDGLAALERISREVIEAGGVVVDLQRDTVLDSDGERPIIQLEDGDQDEEWFGLHVFFNQADRVSTEGMATLLGIIEQELPEALPHRYGTYEPLPYRWNDGGAEAFLERWDRKDPPSWIGKTPASHVFSSFDYVLIGRKSEFRAGRFEFLFRAKLARQPAKLLGVLRLAERFAIELDAFYVALIAGDQGKGPFWKGLFPSDHLMLILGRPLLDCWPDFEALSQPLRDRHRVAGGSQTGTVRLRPPPEVCDPNPVATDVTGRTSRDYAERFPFEKRDPYA